MVSLKSLSFVLFVASVVNSLQERYEIATTYVCSMAIVIALGEINNSINSPRGE